MNSPTDSPQLLDLAQECRAFHTEVCKDYRKRFEFVQSDYDFMRKITARFRGGEGSPPSAMWRTYEWMTRVEIMVEVLCAILTVSIAWMVLSKP